MLTYDEIPAERLPILDYTSRLGDDGHIGDLAVALAQWAARDETKADPHARRAANTAMDATDAALALLHELRARLVSEIRASDDQAAARVDALLAARKGNPMSDGPHDHARPGLADTAGRLARRPAPSSTAPTGDRPPGRRTGRMRRGLRRRGRGSRSGSRWRPRCAGDAAFDVRAGARPPARRRRRRRSGSWAARELAGAWWGAVRRAYHRPYGPAMVAAGLSSSLELARLLGRLPRRSRRDTSTLLARRPT